MPTCKTKYTHMCSANSHAENQKVLDRKNALPIPAHSSCLDVLLCVQSGAPNLASPAQMLACLLRPTIEIVSTQHLVLQLHTSYRALDLRGNTSETVFSVIFGAFDRLAQMQALEERHEVTADHGRLFLSKQDHR